MSGAGALPYRPCVGLVLVNARGGIFAGQRRDQDGAAWQMPQGGIDPGETPRQAGLRELGEETGIPAARVQVLAESADWHSYDLPPDLMGKAWGGRWRGQRQKWLLLRYLGRDADIRLEGPHAEFTAWRWMPPEALLDAIVPFKRAVYRAVLAEFAPLLRPDA